MATAQRFEAAMQTGRPRVDASLRFQNKYIVDPITECWDWQAAVDKDGYGKFVWYNTSGRRRERAHRFAYTHFVGPIPEGLCLDHLCRNRGCVNPHHLEPVSNAENVMRGEGVTAKNSAKTHCSRGHELSPPSPGNQYRRCFICNRETGKKNYNKLSEEKRQEKREKNRAYMKERRQIQTETTKDTP